MSEEINPKFGVPLSEEIRTSAPFASRAYTYPDVYEVQRTPGYERLALAPAADPIGVLRDLSDAFEGPFGILYVLSLSRRGEAKPGRYQSPEPIEGVLLHSFLEDHRAFLEGDARHAIWVFALDANATLVYDRHNVLYAYGPLERTIKVAEARPEAWKGANSRATYSRVQRCVRRRRDPHAWSMGVEMVSAATAGRRLKPTPRTSRRQNW